MMAQRCSAAVVLLGGDGTMRAAAPGLGDTPMLALSTGTNNAFPIMIEATVAGMALGLIATGRAHAPTARAKVLHVDVAQADGTRRHEIALVDVCVNTIGEIGSRAVWKTDTLRELYCTFAEPDAIGLSSIPGRIMPTGRAAPNGVAVLIGHRWSLIAHRARTNRAGTAGAGRGRRLRAPATRCHPPRRARAGHARVRRRTRAGVRSRRPDRRHARRRRSPRDRCSRGARRRMFLLLNRIDEVNRRGDPMTQTLSSLGADAPDASGLNETQLLDVYRTMRSIRAFEDRVHDEFATGDIPGFVHLYAGEEASATGVCAHLDPDRDTIASTHRGHGHCIAKGVDIKPMMAEIFGRRTGSCHGKGGSMHIADLSKGMLGANGIVGGGPPLICGTALAAKLKGDGGVGVAFFGDGASNQGTTLEAMNLASVWNLPAIFVAENNGYAEATSSTWSVAADNIADRAAGFGMPGVIVDGFDFFAVYEAAGEAIKRARQGGGPTLLEVKLTRYYGHFEGDQQKYRGPDEVANARENLDCLKRFRRRVVESGRLTDAQLDQVDSQVAALIDEAVAEAKAAPLPTPEDLLTDVYVKY